MQVWCALCVALSLSLLSLSLLSLSLPHFLTFSSSCSLSSPSILPSPPPSFPCSLSLPPSLHSPNPTFHSLFPTHSPPSAPQAEKRRTDNLLASLLERKTQLDDCDHVCPSSPSFLASPFLAWPLPCRCASRVARPCMAPHV